MGEVEGAARVADSTHHHQVVMVGPDGLMETREPRTKKTLRKTLRKRKVILQVCPEHNSPLVQ